MTRFDCDQLLSKLDDLIDGALREDEVEAAHAHLDACPSCRTESDRALELQAAVRRLPQNMDPERDLWPGIAGRIDARRVILGSFGPSATRALRTWSKIAAAAAVLIASVTVAYLVGLEQARPKVAESPPWDSGFTVAAYGDASSDLEEARNELRAGLERRRDELSSETWSVVVENLAVIDQAIVRIEAAMQQNPDDGRLNRQLATAYLRQIDLLQKATQLPSEA